MTATIESMAREAGLVAYTADGAICSASEALARFAELVRADERERAAKVCAGSAEDYRQHAQAEQQDQGRALRFVTYATALDDAAAAIRALPPSP